MTTQHINTLIVMTKRALEKSAFTVDEMPIIYDAIKAAEAALTPKKAEEAKYKPEEAKGETGQARSVPSRGIQKVQ